ncbi:NmrA family NAD(P)-binding protein [Allostreptomyces psammosilenae]|uniref:Uncharacterized protein YbjT (DUF2867 family) n=1 Tax=Allostreptomyces psammosilenae TaxID=1892865 RepID=A0A853ACD8_9ACTN|nr:NAD(P)H-binding protein [Allostreptomyces psammosilenae]NYI08211.1 uncharacterized protein YbjT (DUF2867 family) [Allostreptomyces psammosilenae]
MSERQPSLPPAEPAPWSAPQPGSAHGSPTVLVTGGTGTTGSRVVRMLREEAPSARVRLASRHPDPDGERADPGVEAVRFDWRDPLTHAAALRGADRVYLVAPVAEADPAPLVETFLHAARRAGVRRVVALSSSAVAEGAPGLGRVHRMVRELFPDGWTVLRPSWFMQNFLGDHPLAEGIRRDGTMVTATGAGRLPFVDAEDIAAVAVRALLDDAPHNTAHLVTGPEALDYGTAAEIISRVSGRPVRHQPVSVAERAARYVAGGYPADFAAALAELDAAIRDGLQEEVSDVVRRLTGRPPRSFAAFAQAHRDAWRAPVGADGRGPAS